MDLNKYPVLGCKLRLHLIFEYELQAYNAFKKKKKSCSRVLNH